MVKLGQFGPHVSEVCYGSLAVSPLQGRVSEEEAVKLLAYGFARGINWLDTAEIYNNYPIIAKALNEYPQVRVVTKSYSVTGQEMKDSIDKARRALNKDQIDFFLLHEQESALTLKGHKQAWEELLRAKGDGRVGWIGISTHAVAGVKAGALLPGIDVIHPIINYQGLGIIDGSLDQMIENIQFAKELGIGIYAMKVFGGGHLTAKPEEAINFIRRIDSIQAMALGMSSPEEIDFNLAIVEGNQVSQDLREVLKQRERKLYIADWCEGCGRCLESCPQGALILEEQVRVKQEDCVLCGYCGRACPHFCLKIV